ncbi:MAG: hypothetical protein ACI8XM_000719 [Haloarculaceae archaeon]|jgi:hypothetical protein
MSTTTNTTNRAESSPEPIRELNPIALASAGAVVAAAVMVLLGIFGAVGVYEGAVRMMEQWHLFFEPTVVGTVAGVVEAVIITFAFTYSVAWLYNVFAQR